MFGSLFSNFDPGLLDDFRRLEGEMDQLFGRTAYPAGIRAVPRGTFLPINVGSTPERVDVYLYAGGLDPKSIDVSIQQNLLTVTGKRSEEDTEGEYLHRGIAARAFERRFQLADFVEAGTATFEHGLLTIELKRVVPEAMRAWNPLKAPQAIVTKRNGKMGPLNTGPVWPPANSLNAGTEISGRTSTIAPASMTITPTFMKVDR